MEIIEKLNQDTEANAPLEVEAEPILETSSRPLRIPVSLVDLLSDYSVAGVLVSFTPGEVAILVDEQVSEQRDVEVRLNSFAFLGHTLYCRPNDGQYEAHVSIGDVDRSGLRRAPRFPVSIPAELLLTDAEPVPATIRDISRDGMGIESTAALEPGQPIGIRSAPAFVFAVVRHCNPMPGGRFRAGVEMHHLFESPEPQVSPVQPPVVRTSWGKWFNGTNLNVPARGLGLAK